VDEKLARGAKKPRGGGVSQGGHFSWWQGINSGSINREWRIKGAWKGEEYGGKTRN